MRSKAIWIGLLLVLFVWAGYLCSQKPRVFLGPQMTGIVLLRGGYRSWVVECSYGTRLDNGKELWHWPTFRHSDVREFLKQNPTE